MGTGQLLAVPSLSLCGGTTIDLSLLTFPNHYRLDPRLFGALLQGDQEERRVRFAWLWQAGEAEKESAHRHQSQDAAKDQDPCKDRG
jgi:hypothetical protein